MPRTVYVTTPIYYVNAAPHIGHAYTTLAVDSLTRWHALLGADTFMLTGTDEHGLKIAQAARDAGVTPQQHADHYSKPFREMCDRLGVRYGDFIRTTEDRHKTVVQEMWRRMEAAGDIYESVYEGWYSVGDEAYFTEDELVDGKAPSGHTVEWLEEASYFFRLSKYGPRLLEHLDAYPEFVRPQSRANEVRRFIEQGLNDISVSRSNFDWGVAIPGADGHVAYVWVDALTNYISALGAPDGDLFGRYWPTGPDDTERHAVHLIGKDILRFHAIYWPAFLMSAGLPLPSQVFAHGWWTNGDAKMSKTVGNVIDPFDMAERYGADAFRYFLLREITFGTDGAFSETALRNRINGDLANDYGNLVNRTLGMLMRYRQGVVPERGTSDTHDDPILLAAAGEARSGAEKAMESLGFNQALAAIWGLVSAANKYVDSTAPWKLDKAGEEKRLDEALYNQVEALRIIGILTQPFLPHKAGALLDWLGVDPAARTFEDTARWGALASGTQVKKGKALFPRIDPPKAETAAAAPKKTKNKAPRPAAQKEAPVSEKSDDTGFIEFGDFTKVDMRVAKIVAAEAHPNADRLLKLTVDAGEAEPRTVCAGIAAAYAPEDLVGRTVALVANLAPRKLRGVMSQGMLLAAGEGADVQLMTVPGDIAPGTRIS